MLRSGSIGEVHGTNNKMNEWASATSQSVDYARQVAAQSKQNALSMVSRDVARDMAELAMVEAQQANISSGKEQQGQSLDSLFEEMQRKHREEAKEKIVASREDQAQVTEAQFWQLLSGAQQ